VNITRAESAKYMAKLQNGSSEAPASADLIAAMRTEMQELKKEVQLSVRSEMEVVRRDFHKDVQVDTDVVDASCVTPEHTGL
jgi:hypothetical protein